MELSEDTDTNLESAFWIKLNKLVPNIQSDKVEASVPYKPDDVAAALKVQLAGKRSTPTAASRQAEATSPNSVFPAEKIPPE